VINGTVDATASVLVRRGDPVAELSFASVRKRGVKQALNFGAVKALMQLTGNYGSAMSGISKADFNYSTLAGRVTYRDGYVTLEGLAGVKGPNQILLKGPAVGQGINIFVNSTTNTIRLEDLRRRVENALSTFG